MEEGLLAGRSVGEVYNVKRRDDIHDFLLSAVRASGGEVLYASDPDKAPVYLGIQLSGEERLGLIVYPFRVTRKATRNRPDDEVRGQLRYGGESSWNREHPIWRDVAGVDVTIVVGVDVEGELILGLDAGLWDPLPMGISFYAKREEVDRAQVDGWHVWEKINKPGTKRQSARSPSNLETVVAFTPSNLVRFARLERRATSLRLDPPLRFAAALAAKDELLDPSAKHVLEEQFALTSQQILDIIHGRNRLAVAVRGGVAEHHLEGVLRSEVGVAEVSRLDVDAKHDFDVRLTDGRKVRIECKNASPKLTAAGLRRVEVQKTRSSKGDPASRFYPTDNFDVVAACIFSSTGRWEFRFARTSVMDHHREFGDRLAAIHVIDRRWADSLLGALIDS